MKSTLRHFHSGIGVASALAASLAAFSGASAFGQTSSLMRFESRSHREASGVHTNESRPGSLDETAERETRHFTVVRADGANLIRIHFGQFDLDRVSEIHITSIADGATQRFSHAMLEAWDGWSAIFNGDAVLVQLLVAPEESVSFEIDEVAVNMPPTEAGEGQGDGGVASLCGADGRVASTDARVGRLSGANCGSGGGCGGCTAWLTSIGCALTAGHCGTASGGLIEFNVPDSSTAGLPVASAPEDQYPVGQSYYAFQNADVGFDWAIMDVGPNANTGLRAHWVQGYFHLDPDIPSDNTTLRITGYGVDNSPSGSAPSTCCAWSNGSCIRVGCNADSLTLQTSTGPKSSHTTNALEYAVDTEPANSGSPVIVNSSDFAIGIHTNGGCTSSGGSNSGTRLTQAVLSEYLNIFLGTNVVFVDFANVSSTDLGTALNPLPTVTGGISAAPTGGTVAIAGGTYSAASGHVGTFTKAVTLRAVSGDVTIGN